MLSDSIGANKSWHTRRRGLDGRQETWNQRPEIGKPVRLCLKHNNGDRVAIQILLKRQVSINRDKYIEVLRRKGQQRSVLDCRPTPSEEQSSRRDRRYRARGANRRIRRAEFSRSRFNHSRLGFLQESDDVLSRH